MKSDQNLKDKIPDFQSIMLPMLDYLGDGNFKTLNNVINHLSNHYDLTEEHLRYLDSTTIAFQNFFNFLPKKAKRIFIKIIINL